MEIIRRAGGASMVLHRTAVRHAEVVRVERRENFYVSNVRGILGEDGIGRYTPDGSFVRLKNPFRGWATLKCIHEGDCKLILRRSTIVRLAAVAVIVISIAWLFLLNMRLSDSLSPEDTHLLLCLTVGALAWAVNTLRRRTVLSESGIEMRGLLFAELRPWPATRSKITFSTIEIGRHCPYGVLIYRNRLMLINGALDDLIRLPGSVSWVEGEYMIERIWSFAEERGWVVSDLGNLQADPEMVRARGEIDRTAIVNRKELTYCAPAVRKLKEMMCSWGVIMFFMAALPLAGAQDVLRDDARDVWLVMLGVTLLILGAIPAVILLVGIVSCFRRTLVRRAGIQVKGRVIPWPESRSDLYVAGDRVFLAGRDGSPVPLPATGLGIGGFKKRQERAIAQCESIWLWGVTHGVAEEHGRYIRLQDEDMQRDREVFEIRAGLKSSAAFNG